MFDSQRGEWVLDGHESMPARHERRRDSMTKEQDKLEAWEEARDRARRAAVDFVDEAYDAVLRLIDINSSLEQRLEVAERERDQALRERSTLWKERLLKSSDQQNQ
jgi:hypothetical protein